MTDARIARAYTGRPTMRAAGERSGTRQNRIPIRRGRAATPDSTDTIVTRFWTRWLSADAIAGCTSLCGQAALQPGTLVRAQRDQHQPDAVPFRAEGEERVLFLISPTQVVTFGEE